VNLGGLEMKKILITLLVAMGCISAFSQELDFTRTIIVDSIGTTKALTPEAGVNVHKLFGRTSDDLDIKVSCLGGENVQASLELSIISVDFINTKISYNSCVKAYNSLKDASVNNPKRILLKDGKVTGINI
jgi:hypothetical protein